MILGSEGGKLVPYYEARQLGRYSVNIVCIKNQTSQPFFFTLYAIDNILYKTEIKSTNFSKECKFFFQNTASNVLQQLPLEDLLSPGDIKMEVSKIVDVSEQDLVGNLYENMNLIQMHATN